MKKLTRKTKEKFINKGICWKCGKATIKKDKHAIWCETCDLKIVKY